MHSELRYSFWWENLRLYEVATCAILILASSVMAQPDASPLQRNMKMIKEHYQFDEWAGSTKVPGRLARQLNLHERDFAPEIKLVSRGVPSTYSSEGTAFIVHGLKDASPGFSLDVKLLTNAEEAQEAMFRVFQMSSAPLTIQGSKVKPGERFDLGDHCIYAAQIPRVMFTRNNVRVIIRGDAGARLDDLHTLAKKVDDLVMALLQNENEPPLAAVPEPHAREIVPANEKVDVSNGGRGSRRGALEEMERQLKALPEAEARRRCLEAVEKLAENPDAEPEKLEFYMRGLGRPFDPPEVKVLRQVVITAKNGKLRRTAMRQLAKWITDDADSRGKVLRTLAEHVHAPDAEIRQSSLRALGQSGDLRQLKTIIPLLDDADGQVRAAALKAVADLLGWKLPKPADAETLQQQIEQAKQASASVMRALEEAERVLAGHGPH